MSKNGSISFTRDALRGHTVSKNGSISCFFFFFFVVATNVYINLFIKLSPLLLGMYCSDSVINAILQNSR